MNGDIIEINSRIRKLQAINAQPTTLPAHKEENAAVIARLYHWKTQLALNSQTQAVKRFYSACGLLSENCQLISEKLKKLQK